MEADIYLLGALMVMDRYTDFIRNLTLGVVTFSFLGGFTRTFTGLPIGRASDLQLVL